MKVTGSIEQARFKILLFHTKNLTLVKKSRKKLNYIKSFNLSYAELGHFHLSMSITNQNKIRQYIYIYIYMSVCTYHIPETKHRSNNLAILPGVIGLCTVNDARHFPGTPAW